MTDRPPLAICCPTPRYKSFCSGEEDRAQLQLALSQIEHNTRIVIELVYFQKSYPPRSGLIKLGLAQ